MNKLNKDRYFQALSLREKGKTFREIGLALNVCTPRARQLANKGKLMKENPEPKWLKGLEHIIALRIKRIYNNKREVIAALKNGDIGIKKGRVCGTIENIGKISISKLYEWLDISEPEIIRKSASPASIEKAKKLLEYNGYQINKLN